MTGVLAALIALTLLLPATAAAQGSTTNAPPGNSAIDEYLETVPGASGNNVAPPPDAGDSALTAAKRERLEQLGADGKTLADVVESSSPAQKKPKLAQLDGTGRSPLGTVLGGADGDGGMGLALPAILLASLLTIIALVLLRRRSSAS